MRVTGVYETVGSPPFEKWIAQQRGASLKETECVVLAVFHEKHPKYQLYAKHYGKVPFSVAAESRLNYYSLASKKGGAFTFSSRAVYLVNPRCREDFENSYGKIP